MDADTLRAREQALQDEMFDASSPYPCAALTADAGTAERFVRAVGGPGAEMMTVRDLAYRLAARTAPPSWPSETRRHQEALCRLAHDVACRTHEARRPLACARTEPPWAAPAHAAVSLRPCARLILCLEIRHDESEALLSRAEIAGAPSLAVHLIGSDADPQLALAAGRSPALGPRAIVCASERLNASACASALPLLVAHGRCDVFVMGRESAQQAAMRVLYTVAPIAVIEPATHAWWKRGAAGGG